MTEKRFVETYCHNCGTQRCEGIGTEWFEGCKYKWNLDGMDAATKIERLEKQIYDLATKIVRGDFVEVKHGEWIGRCGTGPYDDYYCSLCGMYEEATRNIKRLGKYCSYCGARMDGGKEE